MLVADDAVTSIDRPQAGRCRRHDRSPDGFFDETDQPGLYTIDTPAGASSFAVNLDPLESKTAPLHVETIEQFGVRLANHSRQDVDREQLRQMHNAELEGRQKFWRWLILAVIGILIVETWLAGRTVDRPRLTSRGGFDDMSTRTATSIGTGREALPARAALDWAHALAGSSGPWPAYAFG